MDVLRFIFLLPVTILIRCFLIVGRVLGFLGRCLSFILGHLSWRAPYWLKVMVNPIKQGCQRHQTITKISAALGLWGILIGSAVYVWLINQPQPVLPERMTVSVVQPSITDFIKQTPPNPAVIYFSGSAAPIEKVGKSIEQGIEITPPIEGIWTWIDDQRLQFMPKEEWQVGTEWKVKFKADLVAPQVLLAQETVTISAPALVVTVNEEEFYQDPENAAVKQAIVHFNFTHPIDPKSFEQHLSVRFALAPYKKYRPLGFKVTYDEHYLNAWVKSAHLTPAKAKGVVDIRLAKGVKTKLQGVASQSIVSTQVAVPDVYGLLLNGVNVQLVDNAQFETEQALLLEFSDAVKSTDLNHSVEAWVLPLHNTTYDDHSQETSWSLSDVSEMTLKKSTVLSLTATETENDYEKLQSFRLNVEPNRWLYVRFKSNIHSFGGYQLAEDAVALVQIPPYPAMINIMAEGALLPMKGDKRLSVAMRNVPGLRADIGRVKPDQLQHLVSMNQGSFVKPELSNLTQDRIIERFTETRTLLNTDPKKALYEQIDLSSYLLPEGEEPRRGIFLVQLHPYDVEIEKEVAAQFSNAEQRLSYKEEYNNFYYAQSYEENFLKVLYERYNQKFNNAADYRLIVVTDLGIMAKRSLEGGRDIYIQSIESGQPVSEALVEVVAQNGDVLLTQHTGEEGHVHFDSLAGFTNERAPVMYRVQKAGDVSFLPIISTERRLSYSRFDIFGLNNSVDKGTLTAHLFSDRGLYRPGETVNVGIIVRAEDWDIPLQGIPLKIWVQDARGANVHQQTLRLGAEGFESIQFATANTAPTGSWQIYAYLMKNAQDENDLSFLGHTTIRVKEFEPDRLKVTTRLQPAVNAGWVNPNNLSAYVEVYNLFGTPADQRVVEGSLYLQPYWPSFSQYENYQFHQPNYTKDWSHEEALTNQTTNEEGKAQFTLDLSAYANSSYRLNWVTKAYEQNSGRYVAATTSVLVSDREYLIGKKAQQDLQYIHRGARAPVELIAVNPHLEKIAVENLTANLFEKKYVSVLTKQDSGVYKYQSKERIALVSTEPFSIDKAGSTHFLSTHTPGFYSLELTDQTGTVLAKVDYTVVGAANLSRSLERDAELQLKLNQQAYEPGEEIEVAIQAPYIGSGLITIERDRIYAQSWFRADTTSSVQRIRIPADFEGHGYVNVQFMRDTTSDEIYMSPLSYAVVPFKMSLKKRTAALSVEVPERIQPGDTLKLQVTTQHPQRVVVFAVDEGILQVARYTLENPLESFFQKRQLDVQTSQILDLILPDFARAAYVAAPGGGGSDDMAGQYLNPFARKREAPVVYWSGLTEVNGSHTFEYPVPEYFNGKLRVMAISVSPDQIGRFETTSVVRGDFVLTPTTPLMVAPNDVFEVNTGVANNLTDLNGQSVPIQVSVVADEGLTIVGETSQTLTLAEMREGVAKFQVKAGTVLGSRGLQFTATWGEKSVTRRVELSVRPATPYETVVTMGQTKQAEVELNDLRQMYDDYARRQLKAGHTPLVLVEGLTAYLQEFAYSCTEQIISRFMPVLIAKRHPALSADIDQSQFYEDFQKFIQQLQTRQNNEGGFGVWRATPIADHFVSTYVVLFLLEAKNSGMVIPESMLNEANRYLKSAIDDQGQVSLEALRHRALAAYLLTRQGQIMTNELATLHSYVSQYGDEDWQNDILMTWLAASYQLLKQEKIAYQLIQGPLKVLTRKDYEAHTLAYSHYNDSLIQDAATLWVINQHFPQLADQLSTQSLDNLIHPVLQGRFNTLSSAFSLLALESYGNRHEQAEALLSITATLADQQSVTLMREQTQPVFSAFSAEHQALQIHNPEKRPLWYSMVQTGYDRAVANTAVKSGLEIVREYKDETGQPVQTVQIGQEIEVHLKVRALNQEGVSSIAVVDLLPGGFEVVQGESLTFTEEASEFTEGESEIEEIDESDESSEHREVFDITRWYPEHADIRDDRVVVYGSAEPMLKTFVYRIRAVNPGVFTIPPAYAEALYDRSVRARAPSEGHMTIIQRQDTP